MTEDERLALIAKLETSIEETKLLTPEQALGILYRDGFVDIEGNLRPYVSNAPRPGMYRTRVRPTMPAWPIPK